MSIDGFNLASIQDVPLTAVHVPRDELGTEAVYMLQQRLVRPEAPVSSLLLNGTLAVRSRSGGYVRGNDAPPLNRKVCMIVNSSPARACRGYSNPPA